MTSTDLPLVTEGNLFAGATQGGCPGVTKPYGQIVTVGSMIASDYWRKKCAPILRARKQELGLKMTEREIAAAVEAESGKDTGRVLVHRWLDGSREPYVSQLVALCKKMGVSLTEVLHGASTQVSEPLFRSQDVESKSYKKSDKTKVRTTR